MTDPMDLDSLGRLPPAVTAPAYRIRLDGDRYAGTVTTAILYVASEFPGSRQVVIDVAHGPDPAARSHAVSLPCWINAADPAWLPALRRVLRAHER